MKYMISVHRFNRVRFPHYGRTSRFFAMNLNSHYFQSVRHAHDIMLNATAMNFSENE